MNNTFLNEIHINKIKHVTDYVWLALKSLRFLQQFTNTRYTTFHKYISGEQRKDILTKSMSYFGINMFKLKQARVNQNLFRQGLLSKGQSIREPSEVSQTSCH